MKRRQFLRHATGLLVPATLGFPIIARAQFNAVTDLPFLASSGVGPNHLLASLRSYYKLDNPSYTADSQGSNILTQSGGTNNSSGGIINGYVGSSSDLTLSHAHNSDFDLGTGVSFSISMWIRPETSQSTFAPIVGQYGGTTLTSAYLLFLNGGNLKFNGYSTDSSQQSLVIAAQPSVAWHHIVVGYDSPNKLLFAQLDNASRVTLSTTADLNAVTNDFQISFAIVVGSNFFDGGVDEIAFYKKVLSTVDVGNLWNGGAGLPFASFTA